MSAYFCPLLVSHFCPVFFCFLLDIVLCLSLRVKETHYENISLQKEQKTKAKLNIPRYHELVTKQEEKKASLCLFFAVSYMSGLYCSVLDKSIAYG